MRAIAISRYAKLSSQKCNEVCKPIRGMSIGKALDFLKFTSRKAATILRKLLDSAIANAEHNFNADIDELYVAEVYANQGPSYKRMRACAKGRGASIRKPTSHITIVVSDEKKKEKRE